MNLDHPKPQPPLWSRPLQCTSRSGDDVNETAILSSIQALDHSRNSSTTSTRVKRSRSVRDATEAEPLSPEPQHEEHRERILLPPSTTSALASNDLPVNPALSSSLLSPSSASVTTTTQTTTTTVLKPPVFQVQPLSLDRGAIAPGLKHPTAPFAKSERKKAYVSAIYYSECFLRNIQPVDADSAAWDIQNQYTKWWIQSKKTPSTSPLMIKQQQEQQQQQQQETTNDSTPTCKDDSITILDDTDASEKKRRLSLVQTESSSLSSLHSETATAGWTHQQVTLLKERLIEHLQKTGGDTTTTEFYCCLQQLKTVYAAQRSATASKAAAATSSGICTDGTWLTLSKPTFSECQGRNENGEYMYSLGRMSFDMFRPTHLKCSIRAVMNNIRVMDPKRKPQSFPSRLGKELQKYENDTISRNDRHHRHGRKKRKYVNPIRHYDIVVAFTIEANQTLQGVPASPSSTSEYVVPRPIRGLMTNHGYMVADPTTPDRSSIWFSGGSIEVQDEVADADIWKQIFDESMAPRRDMRAMANLLAAKLLLGAYTTTSTDGDLHHDDDNEVNVNSGGGGGEDVNVNPPTMSYFFKRPIGGHGEVYCDVLYLDDTLRILQGHRGSIFVFSRVPNFEETDAQE